ncbi:MAG: CoA transferase [Alphaproteobacteria bacterium]|nr:CoA transferase [Alphaproteobacteria bacterium]
MDTMMKNSLEGLKIIDFSRILAGPFCTQLLGDLGAEIIKIERPYIGDDTRGWGPPYIKDKNNEDSSESAYYLCCNRNKKSVAIDIATPEGQKLAKDLISHADIILENFKVGDMKKYGLDYKSLKKDFPKIIYCSITGFGQTGPYAKKPGYDLLIQALGGIMSITGEPNGNPMKVGVAIADIMCGMYAANAILAALHHRTKTGIGQYIDLGLLDTQVSWLANVGLNYLTTGISPKRMGNEHPNIVPYNVLPCCDGYIVLGIGNDQQFQKFCQFAGIQEWAQDKRFALNSARVKNRDLLYRMLSEIILKKSQIEWTEGLTKIGVPCSPVHTIDQVFNDPQIKSRDMHITIDQPLAYKGYVDLIGNPIKFSETPVSYRLPPPLLGQHTNEILNEWLNLSETELKDLAKKKVI